MLYQPKRNILQNITINTLAPQKFDVENITLFKVENNSLRKNY